MNSKFLSLKLPVFVIALLCLSCVNQDRQKREGTNTLLANLPQTGEQARALGAEPEEDTKAAFRETGGKLATLRENSEICYSSPCLVDSNNRPTGWIRIGWWEWDEPNDDPPRGGGWKCRIHKVKVRACLP